MARQQLVRGLEWLSLGVAAVCAVSCSSLRVTDATRTVYSLEPTTLADPSYCFLRGPISKAKPANAGDMPSFAEGSAEFMSLRFGDSEPALVAIERLSRDGKAGYRVYVDTDRDRSLADETPCEAREDPALGQGPLYYTPPLTLPVVYRSAAGEVSRDCRFRLGFYPVPQGQDKPLGRVIYFAQVVALEGRAGYVSFGGKKLRLTLADGDGDAKLTVGDVLSRDRMSVGGEASPASDEESCLTKCVEVGGVLYSLEVQPDGSEVAVSRYTGPVATVCWSVKNGSGGPAELSQLSFSGANLSISCANDGGRAVPPGSYSLSYLIGASGSNVAFRAPRPITVAGGTTNRIACGGPVALTCHVRQDRDRAEGLTLRVDVSAANEAGHAFQIIGAQHAGKVEVFGPDGKPRGSDNMEYG